MTYARRSQPVETSRLSRCPSSEPQDLSKSNKTKMDIKKLNQKYLHNFWLNDEYEFLLWFSLAMSTMATIFDMRKKENDSWGILQIV